MESPEEKRKPRDEATLKKLALEIHRGEVFGSWGVRNADDICMVFMVLILSPPETIKEMQDEEVVHIYEHLSKALPHSINGMPCFLSCQMITKPEMVILSPMLEKLQAQEEEFLCESSPSRPPEMPAV